MTEQRSPIPALLPANGEGHQFVVYADCCSGVPGTTNERTFAAVNAVLQRLDPQPEFILFPGDEIRGLVADSAVLREQWRYWLEEEMTWLDRDAIPLYHTTANHTVYDPQSETIFRDVMAHLPRNGPPGQEGLSYFVRRGDLLMVFINTLWSGLGGEGWVETEWLDATLATHDDVRHKLVIGHHPVFPTNGFTGDWQRQIETGCGHRLWEILVRHRVFAFLCSHMLAFDVQVHQGVLQILTAGAGTAPLMPETEYHHLVQMAIDRHGLRYQALDTTGAVRESMAWPIALPDSSTWPSWQPSTSDIASGPSCIAWRFSGISASDERGDPQTFLAGRQDAATMPSLWIGLRGPEQRLSVLMTRAPGRSPHLWLGPPLAHGARFDIQVALLPAMGPGGVLWRWNDASPWSSMTNPSSWGPEELTWPIQWELGHADPDQPFRGTQLDVRGIIRSQD